MGFGELPLMNCQALLLSSRRTDLPVSAQMVAICPHGGKTNDGLGATRPRG